MQEQDPQTNPKFRQKPFYTVPEGYFEYMATRARTKMDAGPRPAMPLWLRPVIACLIAIVVGIGLYLTTEYYQQQETVPTVAQADAWLEDDLLDLLEPDDLLLAFYGSPGQAGYGNDFFVPEVEDQLLDYDIDFLLEEL